MGTLFIVTGLILAAILLLVFIWPTKQDEDQDEVKSGPAKL